MRFFSLVTSPFNMALTMSRSRNNLFGSNAGANTDDYLFSALASGEAADEIALPTPQAGEATNLDDQYWQKLLEPIATLGLEAGSHGNAGAAVASLHAMMDEDDEIIDLPRATSPNSRGTFDFFSSSSDGSGFAIKPDPDAHAMVTSTSGSFGAVPNSPGLLSGLSSGLLSPTPGDINMKNGLGGSNMFDFASSFDSGVPRPFSFDDANVAPDALVPYVPPPPATQTPRTAQMQLTQPAALPALEFASWEAKEKNFPGKVALLDETQLASIDRKQLVDMMAAEKYTDSQKLDIKKRRRLYKNRISAKGAISKKKKEVRSLSMVNTNLVKTVQQLQKQNEILQTTNQQLQQSFSAAQQAALERDQERAAYERKIQELTNILAQLDPSAANATA